MPARPALLAQISPPAVPLPLPAAVVEDIAVSSTARQLWLLRAAAGEAAVPVAAILASMAPVAGHLAGAHMSAAVKEAQTEPAAQAVWEAVTTSVGSLS
jgi:hypothetical protein